MIQVTCAVIIQGENLLVAQRKANGSQALKWELPGGKVEPDETFEACLKRELLEELGIETQIGPKLPETVHQYADKTIRLIPFYVTIIRGTPEPLVHERIEWISINQALTIDWSEADIPIINYLQRKTQR